MWNLILIIYKRDQWQEFFVGGSLKNLNISTSKKKKSSRACTKGRSSMSQKSETFLIKWT